MEGQVNWKVLDNANCYGKDSQSRAFFNMEIGSGQEWKFDIEEWK